MRCFRVEYILFVYLICLVCAGCKFRNQKNNNINRSPSNNESIPKEIKDSNKTKALDCKCDSLEYSRSYATDLAFQNIEFKTAKNEELFNTWSNDSLVNSIESIAFSDFDTIPKKYGVFKNVKKVYILNRNGVYGLDLFPNLKSIYFFHSVINLDSDEKWLNQIELLYCEKTKFYGLETFTKMPDLKVIHMAYSGFTNFPTNLDDLDCLQELTLRAYMFGEIDLNQVDLSKNTCLKKVEFQTWYNTLSGLPKGVLKSHIEKLEVKHQKLTEIEKEELNKIKSQLALKYK